MRKVWQSETIPGLWITYDIPEQTPIEAVMNRITDLRRDTDALASIVATILQQAYERGLRDGRAERHRPDE